MKIRNSHFIECPECKGERGFERIMSFNARDGEPDGYWEPCAFCDGKGAVPSFECDCCGLMKPRDEMTRCWPSGMETFACEQCRGG